MTTSSEILCDGFDRVRGTFDTVATGLTEEHLQFTPAPGANPIVWLLWHLTRVQDDHVADAAGSEQVWTAQGFADAFKLPFADKATGYGMDAAQVSLVAGVTADQLLDYHHAVHERTVEYVRTLSEADLDRVVDTRWTPPVTLASRLVSVIADDLQHVGQAAYVKGLLGSV
jgi:hypothetical protein